VALRNPPPTTRFVEDGDWSEADAMRVVDLVAHDNAARIYRLGER
jgi:uncharacterized protein